jgi:hypothetical protein
VTERAELDLAPYERVRDVPRAVRAMRLAVRRALIQHKRDGDPVVVWEDGRVRWIPADEIVIPDIEEVEAPTDTA